jgi:photosynthesis system II assembly factor YCF48-like protein/putative zinc finger protein
MSELSNLLRQRLGAQTTAENNGAGLHPDADTLTAYTEQLLGAAERQQVLKHLAGCADCREVLALSQVEVPALAMQPVLKPVPVSWWRRVLTPAFGVAGLVVAMVVIAVLVVQTPRKSGRPQANNEFRGAAVPDKTAEAKPATPLQPETAPENQPSAQPGTGSGMSRASSVAGVLALSRPVPDRIASSRSAAPPPPPPVLTADLRKQDFVNSAVFETDNEDVVMANQLPSAPQPAKSEARFDTRAPGQMKGFADIPANAISGKSSVAILTPVPPREHFGLGWEKTVIKGARHLIHSPFSAPAINSNSLGSSAMLAKPTFSDSQKLGENAVASAPAKTESAGFAGGRAFSSASRPGSLSSEETTAAAWKAADGKLLKAFGQSGWVEANTGAAFEFTTVNAHGGEVWAGGANAGLIHSYDGGNTWSLVKLGEGASGAIASIFFAGSHIQVTTSDGQSWSSADGGKSWTKN